MRRDVELPPPRPVLWPLRTTDTATVDDEVLSDGRRRLTVRHADLEGLTPTQLAWWYGHVDGDMEYAGEILPRYLVWHPLDHISYEVLANRAPGGAVTAGSRLRVQEAFRRDPRDLLDLRVEVERLDAEAAVIRRRVVGRTVLRLVNRFTPAETGTSYVSVMTIGLAGRAGAAGLNRLLRRRILAGDQAHRWARHHIEEVGNLVHVIPRALAATR